MAKTGEFGTLYGKIGKLVYTSRNGTNYAKKAADKPMRQTKATRNSAQDFGTASKFTSRLYRLLRFFITEYGKPDLKPSLQKRVAEVLRTIEPEQTGVKQLKDGDLKLLEGFRFAKLSVTSLQNDIPSVTFDPQKGIVIQIATNTAVDLFKKIPKAEQIAIKIQAAVLDLDQQNDKIKDTKTLLLNFNNEKFIASLVLPVEFVGLQLIVVTLGVSFLAKDKAIANKRYRAAEIIKVELLKDGVPVAYVPREKEAQVSTEEEPATEWNCQYINT